MQDTFARATHSAYAKRARDDRVSCIQEQRVSCIQGQFSLQVDGLYTMYTLDAPSIGAERAREQMYFSYSQSVMVG